MRRYRRTALLISVVLVLQACGVFAVHRPAAGEVYWSGEYRELLRLVAIGDSLYVLSLGEDSEETPVLQRLHSDGRTEYVALPQVACSGWLDLVGLVPVSSERVSLIAHCDTTLDEYEVTVFTYDGSTLTPELSAFAHYHPYPWVWGGTGYLGPAEPGTVCGPSGGLVRVGPAAPLPGCTVPGAQLPMEWTGEDLLHGCPSPKPAVVDLCRGVPGGPPPRIVVSGFARYDSVAAAGTDILIAGQPYTGRPGVFRASPAGTATRIATGRYRSPVVDPRTGTVLALTCDEHGRECHTVVRLAS